MLLLLLLLFALNYWNYQSVHHVTVYDSSTEVLRRRAPGNGLRQFAMSVMLKVEKKGRTSYSEVADELVRDVANDRSRARAPQVHIFT